MVILSSAELSARKRLAARLLFEALLRRPSLTASVILLCVVVVAAVLAGLLPYGAYKLDYLHRNAAPGWQHWLGTDELGRDVLARLAFGARVSLTVAVISTLIALVVGVTVGSVAGYFGGAVDGSIMRFVDSMYAFPDVLFAILVGGLLKGQLSYAGGTGFNLLNTLYGWSGGLMGVLITLGLTSWLTTARLIRSQLLSLKHSDYVSAAELAGGSPFFILRTHLLPNSLPPILVAITLIVPNAVLLEAGLSFIGVGVEPPTPSWGTMIALGVNSVQSFPHLLIVPAAAIAVTLLALNVVGDTIRDVLDPSLRGRS